MNQLHDFHGTRLTDDTIAAVQKLTNLGDYTFSVPTHGFLDTRTGRTIAVSPCTPTLFYNAIRCGFLPHTRFPESDQIPLVLYYFGPWSVVLERLRGSGFSTDGVRDAIAIESGVYVGDDKELKYVQSVLHLCGFNVGPIDGQPSDRLRDVAKHVGLSTLDRSSVDKLYASMKNHVVPKTPVCTEFGRLFVRNYNMKPSTFGGVSASSLHNGLTITVSGPGRLVVDFENLSK